MDKSTVTMMNWELYVYRGRYRLSGLRTIIRFWEEMCILHRHRIWSAVNGRTMFYFMKRATRYINVH